jgi:hypothetical protein
MPTALAGLPPHVSEPALVRRDLSVDEGLAAGGPACSGVVMRNICVGTGGDSLRWLGKRCIASGSVRWRHAGVVIRFVPQQEFSESFSRRLFSVRWRRARVVVRFTPASVPGSFDSTRVGKPDPPGAKKEDPWYSVTGSVKMIRFSYSNKGTKDEEGRESWWPEMPLSRRYAPTLVLCRGTPHIITSASTLHRSARGGALHWCLKHQAHLVGRGSIL